MVSYSWDNFIRYFRKRWEMGQHISVIGPTGSGKSYLALQLIKVRAHYVLFLTKGKDRTLDKFIRENDIEVIRKWPPSAFSDRVALWPRFESVDDFRTQEIVFRNAINGYRTKGGEKIGGVYSDGVWSVLIDEVMYFKEELHLEQELRMLWTQGRSNDVSLVAGTQRPRDVPQLMLNQWTHLFLFQTTDKYEIDRLSGIGGNVSSIVKQYVPHLKRYEFMYINRLTNDVIRSKVQ